MTNKDFLVESKKYVFPIKTFNLDTRIDPNFQEYQQDIIIRQQWQFSYGGNKLTDTNTDTKTITLEEVPKTIWDSIKIEIIKYTPSLEFGWIIPQYIKRPVTLHTTINNNYINVAPLEKMSNQREMICWLLEASKVTPKQDQISILSGNWG